MPHKHKRKRDDDTANFDLAPNTRAKPLPAYTKNSIFSQEVEATSNKRRKCSGNTESKKSQDDTPKAFARLMAWQSTGKRPNGFDDGSSKPSKKSRKQSQKSTHTTAPKSDLSTSKPPTATPVPAPQPPPSSSSTTHPKILPGESLSTFSLRVDQSLPLSSVSRHNNPALPQDLAAKLKKAQRTTKHNKRLQKMQADWRATEAKLQEKEADEAEDLEDQREEEDLLWSGVRNASTSKKGKKKRVNTNANDDDDPWKDLEKRRHAETKQKNLQDVVTAPPVLKKVKSKFKPRAEDFDALDGKTRDDEEETLLVDVGHVPGKVGSLKRREELNATRKAVIEGYRKMQARKRGVRERLDMARTVVT